MTVSADDLPGLLAKPHKYSARRVVVDGISFPSQREASRWQTLRILEHQGVITNLKRQVRYKLVMETVYVSDFEYDATDTGEHFVEDAKGYRTALYKRKAKLMLEQHGVRIIET